MDTATFTAKLDEQYNKLSTLYPDGPLGVDKSTLPVFTDDMLESGDYTVPEALELTVVLGMTDVISDFSVDLYTFNGGIVPIGHVVWNESVNA